MKKLALAALITIPALATAQNGFYVQGDVGFSRPKVSFDNASLSDNTESYSITVGKHMGGGARLAGDYTYFGEIKEGDAKVEAQGIGVSALYDFTNQSAVTPYLGARVGANRLSAKATAGTATTTLDTTNKVGVGAVGGIQYNINPTLTLDGAIEYNYLGKVDDAEFDQYGATVGLRLNF